MHFFRVASIRDPRIVVLSPRLEALRARCDDHAVLNGIPIAVPTALLHGHILHAHSGLGLH